MMGMGTWGRGRIAVPDDGRARRGNGELDLQAGSNFGGASDKGLGLGSYILRVHT